MNLDDPIAIFTAESNSEAVFLQQLLERAGIHAVCVEDNSEVGSGIAGIIHGLHKPQLWVSHADSEQASQILTRYEELKVAKQALKWADDAEQIEILCDECDQRNVFSVSLTGTVQECVQCAAFLDVGDEEGSVGNEWDVAVDAEEVDEEE